MQCHEIMKTDLQCAAPDESVAMAARRMRDEDIGFLPICDENGRVLGTLTDRDIALRLVAENKAGGTPVREIMTRDLVVCHPRDPIERAEELMSQAQVSRIMCIDENSGRLAGIISLSDLAQYAGGRRAGETFGEVKEASH